MRLNNQIAIIAFLIACCLLFFGWIVGLYTAQYLLHH